MRLIMDSVDNCLIGHLFDNTFGVHWNGIGIFLVIFR
jgi:hypothetical protein